MIVRSPLGRLAARGNAHVRRLLHAGYLIATTRWKALWSSLRCAGGGRSRLVLLADALACSCRHGTSLTDYFNFRFFERTTAERESFASTAFMYEFHRALNDRRASARVDDKAQFRIHYRRFAPRSFDLPASTRRERAEAAGVLAASGLQDVVIKDPRGTTGRSIVFATLDADRHVCHAEGRMWPLVAFVRTFSTRGRLYVEERLRQHEALERLSPSGLNTVRMVTVLENDGRPAIIAAVLRMSVGRPIDNFSAGNVAAEVDVRTGRVVGPGRRKDAACSPTYTRHPITGHDIVGFQIPFWQEVLSLVSQAALVTPEVRTVGWDVAIVGNGVRIIEGNPKWNKDTPQIPSQRGIREQLRRYVQPQFQQAGPPLPRAALPPRPRAGSAGLTRLLDVTIALLGLTLAAPILALIAAAVLVNLGRPVFFVQTRPGLHGRPFRLVKFRTMRETPGRGGAAVPEQARLTRLGRFLRSTSLDELPELWNVLKGDMALVGPRPLRMEYLELYSPEQARRHDVKPGITGWAQVNGRNALTWEEKFAYDVWYVDHRSLWLDLKILARTAVVTLLRTGIDHSRERSMPRFAGSADAAGRPASPSAGTT